MNNQLELTLVETRSFTSKKPFRVTTNWFDEVVITDTVPPETSFVDSVYRNNVIESVTIGIYPDGTSVLINGRRRLAAAKLADAMRWQDELETATTEDRKPLKKNWERVIIPVVVIQDVDEHLVRSLAAELNSKRGDNVLSDISSVGFFVLEAKELGSKDIGQSLKHAARCTGIPFARAKKLYGIGALAEEFTQAIGERTITETNAAKIASLNPKLQKKLLKTLDEHGKITATHIREVQQARREVVAPTSLPNMEIPDMQAEVTLTSVHAAIEQIDFEGLIEAKSDLWINDAIDDESDVAGLLAFELITKLLDAYELDKKRAGF